jgi:predicted Zn-dependent peptidase
MMRALRVVAISLAPMLLAVGYAPLAAQQKQQPPPAGTPKDFVIPTPRRFTLANGLPVTLVPFGQVPKVTVRVVVSAANLHEKAEEIWLADLTGSMMREGTATLTADAVAREFAAMGGELGVSVGPDTTSIGADVLSDRVADAVRLIAEVTQNPRLPESDFARVKSNLLRNLAIQRSSPQALAQEKFASLLYGDHPYGRIFPTDAMLQGYTIDQVRGFHKDNFTAGRARVYVAGRFALLDRPDAPQSTVLLGLRVPNPSHKDWIPIEVTDALLGGAFGSRITTNIRELKGYTYSPYSTLTTHPGQANWVETADVTTKVTGESIKEIFAEVDRLRKDAPPAAELRGIQNNLAGIFVVQNASRGGVIGRLAFVDTHGLGDDYLSSYVKRVMAVTPEEVRRIANEYLTPDKMTLVVLGDSKTVKDQLTPWASR